MAKEPIMSDMEFIILTVIGTLISFAAGFWSGRDYQKQDYPPFKWIWEED